MKTICVNISNYNGSQDLIYIGRPGKWGNPFKIGRDGNREECIVKYKEYLELNPSLFKEVKELKGMALACWCKPKACHGDVLVEILEDDPWKLFMEDL
jgi:hypothetical protein